MLAFYCRWAYRLSPFKPLFIVFSLLSCTCFVWLLFAGAALSNRWQLMSLCCAILFAVLWLWSQLFARELPYVMPEASFFQRLGQRLKLLGFYLLALLFSVILLVSIYLGLRALKGIIIPLFF